MEKIHSIEIEDKIFRTIKIGSGTYVDLTDAFHNVLGIRPATDLYKVFRDSNLFTKQSIRHGNRQFRTWFSRINGLLLIASIYEKRGHEDKAEKLRKFADDFSNVLAIEAVTKNKPTKLGKPEKHPLNDLVQVKNDRPLVSARDLYKALELKIRFSLWVEQNFSGFEEGFDFTSVSVDTDMPNGGVKQIQDYWLSIDMAKELCMMSKTEKGKQVRHYFLQVEKKYRKQMALPQTPEEKLALTMQVTDRLNKRVSKIEDAVDYLKDQSEIDSTQRFQLRKSRNARIVSICGGKQSNFYQTKGKAKKVFVQFEHDFKDHFMIPRYENLKKEQFKPALEFTKKWYAPFDLKQEIDSLNSQTSLNF